MQSSAYNMNGIVLHQASYWALPTANWPVHPFCVELAERIDKIEFHDRNCPFLCIALLLEGSLFYSCDGGPEFEIGQGKVFIIPEGASYCFRSAKETRYRKLVLEIKGPLLKQVEETMRLASWAVLEPSDYDSIASRIQELGSLMQAGRPEDAPAELGLTQSILSSLSIAARKESESHLLIERAKAKLDCNFEQEISIPELAAELGICQSLLGRSFKKEFGVSPRDYRIARRIENAKKLLENTSFSLKEIARRLGYANQLYFSNDFRKHCGMSPSECRETHASYASKP